MASLKKTLYIGTFIHTPTLLGLETLENHVLGVDEHGVIRFAETAVGGPYRFDENGQLRPDASPLERVVRKYGWEWEELGEVVLAGGKGKEFFFPGFIDTHTHASQLPNTGIFGNSTLLDWLTTYTFPLESRFSSLSHARRVYNRAVSSTLTHGTTTAAYYATIHPASTNLLADICLEKGQRAFIGQVCMDSKDTCPDYYRDASAATSLSNTSHVITHIRSLDPTAALITPIITPRFAPSCTKPLLSALGHLARKHALPVQTHIAETRNEIRLVNQMFPESEGSYARVYDHHGLLTPLTVLAHGIHLSSPEIALIRARGCGISHCPLSNTSLGSGICPVRTYLDAGVKVGLGTDVSGGASCSVLVAAREAAGVSRLLSAAGKEGEEGEGERMKIGVAECLFLATRGGAACLGLEGKVGAFEVGMEWDAQLVVLDKVPDEGEEDSSSEVGDDDDGGLVQCWNESSEGDVDKWMYCGDDRNTKKVWVKGKLVHARR